MSKVLIIGSGARECIIVKKLLEDSKKLNINLNIVCIGTTLNPYMKINTTLYIVSKLDIYNLDNILNIIDKIDFVFIGPENPLELGFSNYLKDKNISCIGPLKEYAKIETSKIYCREFLKKHKLSQYSPKYYILNSKNKEIIEKKLDLFDKIVIKNDGLCGGKGVLVQDIDFQTKQDGIEIISNKDNIIIEEKLIGEEYSLMSITDGVNVRHFPPIQDNKRLLDNDMGPNTGGMGCVIDKNNTLPFLNNNDIMLSQKINKQVIELLNQEYKNIGYKGILYGSYIKCNDGKIKIIEFNCRFGDPECILALELLKTNFYTLCKDIINTTLQTNLEFKQNAMIGVYMVPNGYPKNPESYYDIYIDETINKNNIYYANIEDKNNHLYSLLSRTLLYLEEDENLVNCYKKLYRNLNKIHGNLFYRKDIGAKFLSNYEKVGVSIKEGDNAIDNIKKYVLSTYNENVLGNFGDFGGEIQLNSDQNILVCSIDGVGSKSILVTKELGDLGYINLGKDLVNHSINDILVQGAYPLCFLDYFGTPDLKIDEITNFIKGISESCIKYGKFPLIGGEIAEMNSIYKEKKRDLVGCIIGYKDTQFFKNITIESGDILLGFKSSGPHTNGYSLINKIVEQNKPNKDIMNTLLEPHTCYLNIIKKFIELYGYESIKGMCHITGGGLYNNLKRIIPNDLDIILNKINYPDWCKFLQINGNISDDEMTTVFNCGIGFIIVINKELYNIINTEDYINVGYLK